MGKILYNQVLEIFCQTSTENLFDFAIKSFSTGETYLYD